MSLPRSLPQAIYEMRSYQMHPGYNGPVPKLLEAFRQG